MINKLQINLPVNFLPTFNSSSEVDVAMFFYQMLEFSVVNPPESICYSFIILKRHLMKNNDIPNMIGCRIRINFHHQLWVMLHKVKGVTVLASLTHTSVNTN